MTPSGAVTMRTFEPAPVICTMVSVSFVAAIGVAAESARERGRQAAPPMSVLMNSRRSKGEITATLYSFGLWPERVAVDDRVVSSVVSKGLENRHWKRAG